MKDVITLDKNCSKLKCCRCDMELINKRITLKYVGHSFSVEVPCCPLCGQAFISKELASGKMQDVEIMLEDK